ncbi:PIN domain-containing protein [soil metagenome]
MMFLDTNVFVRMLTFDDPVKGEECTQLIESLETTSEAATSEIVIAELVFVLSGSVYKMDRLRIAELLRPIIALRGLKLPDKRRILRTLDLYQVIRQLSFSDCLIAAQVSESDDLDGLVTYDRDFDRVPNLLRYEPAQILNS